MRSTWSSSSLAFFLTVSWTFLSFASEAGAANSPSTPPSPRWQKYFEVTEPLPNVTFNIGRSFAGNLPVQRGTNLSLFFWGVEQQNGSLTRDAYDGDTTPWQIWLNGGPGSSSLFGFLIENGPIIINASYSASPNKYSFDKLADTFWIDQPVGTGYSTLEQSGTGQVIDENQMANDFFGFLENLVQVFPSLATRPLYILGESYAGMYIPYILKHYFGLTAPPVKVAKIAIGDGTMGNGVVFELVPTITLLETFPQLIGYDTEVLQYFQTQNHLCGYDLNLTYPQNGKFPTLSFQGGTDASNILGYSSSKTFAKGTFMSLLRSRYQSAKKRGLLKRSRDITEARNKWKRDLSQRPNGTIDPYYGCSLLFEAVDYALNYSYPYTNLLNLNYFDFYNAPSVLNPRSFYDASVFLNDNATRQAIHAPNQTWQVTVRYDFGGTGTYVDPSPEPMVFMDELATNATKHNISMIFFSGNTDTLVPHRGTEVVIQNTTFGGIQGFTQKPSTPWYNDDGSFAGIVHQERGWTYVLFRGAGHLVAATQPAAAFGFIRDFVLGNSTTGLVTETKSGPAQSGDVLIESPDVYLGSVVTTSTYAYPSKTIAQFYDYLATATATTPRSHLH